MSQNTSNTQAFLEAQQYSQFILENLHDGLLPDGFSRDVTDFGSGSTLNIKTVGDVTIQDMQEEMEPSFNPIDTNTITLSITDYVGDAWAITDELREDHAQIETLHAMRGMAATRALQEHFESRFLETCNTAQTDGAVNNVNGFAHRIGSAEVNDVISLAHFSQMKLAFDKANAPASGRIAIVDPVVEATLNNLYNSTWVSNNPRFEGLITQGFAQDKRFVANIFGWDIYTSNRLDKSGAAGTFGDGTNTVTDAVANVFMTVADDSVKPIMRAWRRQPKTEGGRNWTKGRDEYKVSARFGLGAQRTDTLGILVTSAVNY